MTQRPDPQGIGATMSEPGRGTTATSSQVFIATREWLVWRCRMANRLQMLSLALGVLSVIAVVWSVKFCASRVIRPAWLLGMAIVAAAVAIARVTQALPPGRRGEALATSAVFLRTLALVVAALVPLHLILGATEGGTYLVTVGTKLLQASHSVMWPVTSAALALFLAELGPIVGIDRTALLRAMAAAWCAAVLAVPPLRRFAPDASIAAYRVLDASVVLGSLVMLQRSFVLWRRVRVLHATWWTRWHEEGRDELAVLAEAGDLTAEASVDGEAFQRFAEAGDAAAWLAALGFSASDTAIDVARDLRMAGARDVIARVASGEGFHLSDLRRPTGTRRRRRGARHRDTGGQ